MQTTFLKTPRLFAAVLLSLCVLAALGREGVVHAERDLSVAGQTIGDPGTIPVKLDLAITEFMADNETTLLDADGDTSDWIEIYNASAGAVDLDGWALTDRADNLLRWRFPSVSLAPGEYLVVFASDKNRRTADGELHTNFKLRRDGEFLALVNPDSEVVSSYAPAYPAQFPDVSYGIDADGIERFFPTPTPGTANDVEGNLGPLYLDVRYSPTDLYPGEPLTIVAWMMAGISPVKDLDLHYRIGFGSEVRVAMTPSDVEADGSLEFQAQIPADAFSVGDLVRFYVLAYDSEQRTSRWPIFGSPTNSPRYVGTMVLDPAIATKNPVLYWFVQDVEAASTDLGTRASLFYGDSLYDNVLVHGRGEGANNQAKPSFKFVFNDGYHLRLAPYQLYVDEINLNANVADTTYLRTTLAWESFRDAGSPYSLAFPIRIQRNREFFGLYSFVEQPDRRYFERQDIDWDGAFYKIYFNELSGQELGFEKRTRKDEDSGDLLAFMAGINQEGDARERFIFDNVDLPAVINYLAVNNIIQDWDNAHKNYYLYRDTRGSGEWMFIPWDKDLAFSGVEANDVNSHPLHGSKAHPAVYKNLDLEFWNRLIDAIHTTPATREMYLRRLRTLMDQLLQAPGTPMAERYYESRIAELIVQVAADAELDAERWKPANAFASAVKELQSVALDDKRTQLYTVHAAPGGIIPDRQPDAADIDFGEIDNQAGGEDADAEYFVLRNPNGYAVDISGWVVGGDIRYTFQSGVVIPAGGRLYVSKDVREFRNRSVRPDGGRALFVQGSYDGELSDELGSLQLNNRSGHLVARTAFWGDGETLPGNVYLPLIVNY